MPDASLSVWCAFTALRTPSIAVSTCTCARTWIGHTGGIEVEEDHAAEVRNALYLAGQLYIEEDDGDPVQPPAIVEDPNNGSI